MERLPRSGRFAVTSDQRAAAEAHLVELARHYDATALGRLGRRVFEEGIAPDLAEQLGGRALEQQEALALRRTTFMMWEDEEGTCSGRIRIPALQGQMLSEMILAISSPACTTPATRPVTCPAAGFGSTGGSESGGAVRKAWR